ncbi:hypothetical protein AgCh_023850 [Apium graveolens]
MVKVSFWAFTTFLIASVHRNPVYHLQIKRIDSLLSCHMTMNCCHQIKLSMRTRNKRGSRCNFSWDLLLNHRPTTKQR